MFFETLYDDDNKRNNVAKRKEGIETNAPLDCSSYLSTYMLHRCDSFHDRYNMASQIQSGLSKLKRRNCNLSHHLCISEAYVAPAIWQHWRRNRGNHKKDLSVKTDYRVKTSGDTFLW